VHQIEKLVEGAEGCQPPVDSAYGMSAFLAQGDIIVYIDGRDLGGLFTAPLEEQVNIAGVMNVG
jgi:hypothetical protein